MTENKRFNIKDIEVIKDNLTGRDYVIKKSDDIETLVEILNEYDKRYDEFEDNIFSLERENKELKIESEKLVDLLANEVKKNGDLLSENNTLRKTLMIYKKSKKR